MVVTEAEQHENEGEEEKKKVTKSFPRKMLIKLLNSCRET